MKADYGSILEAQREFFRSGRTRDLDFRIESLKKLRGGLSNHYDELIAAFQRDIKKSEFEIFATEIMCVLDEIDLAIRNLRRWARPRRVATPLAFFKSRSRYLYEPFGCVLVIGAWNYPYFLTLSPIVGAIAAGNCCILKPSEISPNASAAVSRVIAECLDPALCRVVEGGVAETTELLALQFDFILYTGSTRVGAIVAEAAARNLTPVVLEMGGKSPCIVDSTADIPLAARRICWGKFTGAGQTCVAPDYVLVHESVRDELLAALQRSITAFYGENPAESPDYPGIIDERHFDRIAGLIEPESVVFGGEHHRDKLYIAPTVMTPPSLDSAVMGQEIFGPLLPVFTFRSLDECVEIINGRFKNPLALYIFSHNKASVRKIVNKVPFGGGGVNSTLMHVGNPRLPFGGRGTSGIGCYHGRHSFETFSHKKSILSRSTLVDLRFIYPPYRGRVEILKKFYLKPKIGR